MKADDFLKRYIDIEAYADGEAEKALELLEECEGDLDDIILSVPDYHTKAAVSEAESEIKKRTSALSTALSALAIGAAVGVAAKQAKWLSKLYGFDKTPEDFNSFVKFTPYNGKDTIQSASDRLARSVRTAYSSAVRSAWAFGGSSEGAVETAGRQKKSFENSVMSDFETSIPSFAKFADLRTYEANSERIRGYRCCATLDGRTCLPKGEKVLTPDGYKNIEDIQVGDSVIGGSREKRTVLGVMSKQADWLMEIELENGETIKCTPDHLILTERGWVEAGCLEETDVIKESL